MTASLSSIWSAKDGAMSRYAIQSMLRLSAGAHTWGAANVIPWPVALGQILRRHVNVSQFNIGILIFATVTALACHVLHADMMSIVLPVAIGILVGFSSVVYFSYFVRSGNFFMFSIEYLLVSSMCYLLVILAAAVFSFARRPATMTLVPAPPRWRLARAKRRPKRRRLRKCQNQNLDRWPRSMLTTPAIGGRASVPIPQPSRSNPHSPVARLPHQCDVPTRGFLPWRLSDAGPRARGTIREGPIVGSRISRATVQQHEV
jgi:hypothetical protein